MFDVRDAKYQNRTNADLRNKEGNYEGLPKDILAKKDIKQ